MDFFNSLLKLSIIEWRDCSGDAIQAPSVGFRLMHREEFDSKRRC